METNDEKSVEESSESPDSTESQPMTDHDPEANFADEGEAESQAAVDRESEADSGKPAEPQMSDDAPEAESSDSPEPQMTDESIQEDSIDSSEPQTIGMETEELSPAASDEEALVDAPSKEADGPQQPAAPKHPVILVLYASVGSGHRSAALAIGQAFEELRDNGQAVFEDGSALPEDTEVRTLDILDFGKVVFNGDKAASMFTGVTRPLYDLTWRYVFTGRLLWGGGSAFSRVMWPAFTHYVEECKPLAVVCTHIMGANVAVGARMVSGQDFPIVCVPTDYETEGLWPHRAADAFCVATEAMAETLRARKVPEDNIALTGIPTRKDFLGECDVKDVRNRLGLPQDKKVVLAMAGAHLPQPYVLFRQNLDKALPSLNRHKNLHLLVVAGKDEEYGRHVRQECADFGLDNVTVIGYTTHMAEIMGASDLAICKSGGLTVTECLCTGTPMVLLGRAYGQEKVNVNMLTSNGAALHVTTARELMDALNQVSMHPARLEAMLVNASAIRLPNAADDIARLALKLSEVPAGQAHGERKHHFLKFYWGNKPAHIR